MFNSWRMRISILILNAFLDVIYRVGSAIKTVPSDYTVYTVSAGLTKRAIQHFTCRYILHIKKPKSDKCVEILYIIITIQLK